MALNTSIQITNNNNKKTLTIIWMIEFSVAVNSMKAQINEENERIYGGSEYTF
jgi:hypothetical protein